jgi:hypothetical protein
MEKSTALIMASKMYKPLKPLALTVWMYQRCWYFPRLVHEIRMVELNELGVRLLILIRNLGFLWSIEALRVPKNFLRPCVFSAVACTVPVILKSWEYGKVSMFIHAFAMLISSVAHHSNHKLGSFQHRIDRFVLGSFVIHAGIIQNDTWIYLKYVSLTGICCYIMRRMKVHDREWTNLVRLLPQIGMHYMASEGVCQLLDKLY